MSTKHILKTIALIQEYYPEKTFGQIVVGLLDYVESNGPTDQLDWLANTDNSKVLEYLCEFQKWGSVEKDSNGFFTQPAVLQFYKGPRLCPSCSQPKDSKHKPKCPWIK